MMSWALDDSIMPVHPNPAQERYLRPKILLEGDRNIISTLELQSRHDDEHATIEESRSPSANKETLQSWNQPRRNSFRVSAVFFSFFVFGLNDGAYGALLPYLETYYTLSYTVVSLIFLSPFIGYTIAALLNTTIHMRFGQRGVAILATCSHIAAYAVISARPPYPTIVVMYALAGFGYGLIDGAWNAWTGNLQNANAVQGFLSSSYSLGASISPIVATSMSGKQHWGWHTFYWLMTGCALLSLIFSSLSFWDKDGSTYRYETQDKPDSKESRIKKALKCKITWIGATYFFIYFGTQVTLAGWIISFLLRVRHASRHAAGASTTGFQAGQTVGRAALGFATNCIAISDLHFRLAMSIFMACAIALQLIFWLVPSMIVSAVAVAFLGFFLGPLFPAGVVMVLKLLPKHLHVSSIGFATALGGTGGAIFPFAVGAIAQAKGVEVLQPMVLALLLGVLALWVAFPGKSMKTA